MNSFDEPPSVAERYSSAVESSNLRVRGETVRGDADYLIAAGWGGSGLGPRLMRLRKEFDIIKGSRDLANRALVGTWSIELARLNALAEHDVQAAIRAAEVRREMDSYAASEAAFVLMELGDNLTHVKNYLGEMAVVEATRTQFMESDQKAAYIAGRCLSAWLDPLCLKCDGRGFTGGGRHEMSGPPIKCRACRETGKRTASVGNTDAQVQFAVHILALMDQMVADTETGMAIALRNQS